jgi:hypothetical protein
MGIDETIGPVSWVKKELPGTSQDTASFANVRQEQEKGDLIS